MIPAASKHAPVIGPGVVPSAVSFGQQEAVVKPHHVTAQLPLSGADAFVTNPADLPHCVGERQHTLCAPRFHVVARSNLVFGMVSCLATLALTNLVC